MHPEVVSDPESHASRIGCVAHLKCVSTFLALPSCVTLFDALPPERNNRARRGK